MPVSRSFSQTVSAAIDDIAEHGFDSAGRVAFWTEEIRRAAAREMKSERAMDEALRRALRQIYERLVEKGQIARYHQGVSKFTLQKVKPALRAELDRRILASASLIKLNREKAMGDTLRRFEGWATSIPKGGTDALKKSKTKDDMKKALRSLPFQERRVLIDQGHKLNASLSNILAVDGGAIAVIWHSHWRQAGYDYREDHRERDGRVYLLKSSWARDKGLVKPGSAGLYEDITAVGEEVYCRCYAQFVYTVSKLPADMITAKGRAALANIGSRADAA